MRAVCCMMNEDFLMNDTFDNLTFAEFGKIIHSNTKDESSNISRGNSCKSCNVNGESSVNSIPIDEISLDDSAFLKDCSFSTITYSESKAREQSPEKINNVYNVCNAESESPTLFRTNEKENFYLEKEKPEAEQTSLITRNSFSGGPESLKNVDNKPEFEDTDEVIRKETLQKDDTQKSIKTFDLNLISWGLPDCILRKYYEKKIHRMLQWQFECLQKKDVITKNGNIVYSAPTSAGKTLVAEILAIKTVLERKKKVLFILPFVSVVREKMFYFQDIFLETKVRVEGFMGSYNPPGGFESVHVAICTIEKANSLVNKLLTQQELAVIGAVIVDEIHLIGDSSRGYLLELLLTKLKYMSLKNEDVKIQIIGMSATLPNLSHIADWLNAELFITNFRPVPLHELVHVGGEIYNNELKLIRRMHQLPELDVDTDNILQLCLETIQESSSVLIFCPTKNWCENLAQQIASAFWKLGMSNKSLGKLLRTQLSSEMIAETLQQLSLCPVGLDAILKKTVSFGVGFHHAGLTMDERDIIEGAFHSGSLRVLVATSTLSSGVNLPARRVIIRTPIFHGKPIDCLTYRQMTGRAGRMGKDTVGESILICQKNDYQIAKHLFSTKLKEVETCLEESGKIERAILEIIASGIASSPEDVNLFTNCTLLAYSHKENVTQADPIKEAVEYLSDNEFIRLHTLDDGKSMYIPTPLGKACLSSSLPPHEGLNLFAELQKARLCFVLESELHLIYLVTPYSACNQWGNIDWMLFLDLWTKLPSSMKKVGSLVGVEESYIINATRGQISTQTKKLYRKLLIHKRFYIALALQDLVNEHPLTETADKFNCNRGMLQSLQQSASTFAGMVTSFSKQLRWSSIEILISQFQDRFNYGINRDLLDLMRLPVLNGMRARALFNGGIETLSDLANSDITTVENILLKLTPFETTKEREGETAFENMQRNKLRSIWISGKQGVTERQAAHMLIFDARKFLEIELGLVEARWDAKERIRSNSFNENIDKCEDKCIVPKQIHSEQNCSTLANAEICNESPCSISCSLPKTKILNDNIRENSYSESMANKSDSYVFSPLSLEIKSQNQSLNLQNKSYEAKETVSDQSLFEDSFSSSTANSGGHSDKHLESSEEKHIREDVIVLESKQVLLKDSTDMQTPSKKRRFSEDQTGNENSVNSFKKQCLTNGSSDLLVKDIACDVTKFNIIDVCKHPLVFDSFSKQLKLKTLISVCLGCVKSDRDVSVIGEKIIQTKAKNNENLKAFMGCNMKIDGIAVTWGDNTVYYVSLQVPNYINSVIPLFTNLLSNTYVTVKLFDSKNQIKILTKCTDIEVDVKVEDPKVAEWLLDPDAKEKKLKHMESDNQYQVPLPNTEDLLLESALESSETSRPSSSESQFSIRSANTKRPQYPEAPKCGRSKKDANKDKLLSLATATMKKFCDPTYDSNLAQTVYKLSDFDIAGMKYGRDLGSVEPDQRNVFEKIAADALFYAKQKKLTENTTLQLTTPNNLPIITHNNLAIYPNYPAQRQTFGITQPQSTYQSTYRTFNYAHETSNLPNETQHRPILNESRQENMTIMSEFLQFK